MQKINLFICFLILLNCSQAFSQTADTKKKAEEPQESIFDKIYFGGNIGASFGSSFSYFELSPLVGYKVTKNFSAGLGITYSYYKETLSEINNQGVVSSFDISFSEYGGRLFGRYLIFKNVFAYAEYEVLNVPRPDLFSYIPQTSGRIFITSPFLGGGYSQPIGENAHFMIMALWNLSPSTYSKYYYPSSPIIRVGMTLGL